MKNNAFVEINVSDRRLELETQMQKSCQEKFTAMPGLVER
jgi:hypothetical protein